MKFDPENMGHVNLANLKPGECPEVVCPVIKAEKPCPHAKPAKVVFNWQGKNCPACPHKWEPRSCDEPPGGKCVNSNKTMLINGIN